ISELSTDLRRPCTPSHSRKSAPHHCDFLGTPGSRGPASPTPRNLRFRGTPGLRSSLTHLQMGSLRSSAQPHELPPHEIFDFAGTPCLGRVATESLAANRNQSSKQLPISSVRNLD